MPYTDMHINPQIRGVGIYIKALNWIRMMVLDFLTGTFCPSIPLLPCSHSYMT